MMETVHCEEHDLDIKVYEAEERDMFVDDNRREAAIFKNADGSKYLKRYVEGQCDGNCETVIGIMESEE